ncbi:hypothetical protein BT63DRAFT_427535 [Microthyrium microscopicum]|uniref:Uncharacterized protein n=1 Tax=Microthyrium microscopicum TaxID=703497 RepID=A0A6A6U885_9PEZI|nr:hypothetical protein BT63DRAFT_427535 [Microthyrium microscopicum]
MTAATASPPGPPDQSTANVAQKRKLSQADLEPETNGIASKSPTEHESDTPEPALATPELNSLLADILIVLQRHDPKPSILDYTLPEHETSQEPSSKRIRLSDESNTATISAKVSGQHYTSLKALGRDVDTVCDVVLKPIREKQSALVNAPYGRQPQLPADDTKYWASVLAFQKVLGGLIYAAKDSSASNTNGANLKGLTNGIKTETTDVTELPASNQVLTIYAGAQAPRQLFSSFQKPLHVNGEEISESNELDSSVNVTLPLREAALPGFLTVSNIADFSKAAQGSASNKNRKFGERFIPPRQLPTLQVPKPNNRLLTKGNNVSWIPHRDLAKPSSQHRPTYNWASMKQLSGKWLSYNGLDSSKDPNSPEAKRRQRERALSTGASFVPQTEETRLAEEEAKEDALFRSVFSSFAPSVDNSSVVVPDQVRNEIWWAKTGRYRAEKLFIDPLLLGEDDQLDGEADQVEIDEELIEEALKTYEPEVLESGKTEDEEQDEVDKRLQDITELIDTLYSQQKIRLSQLPSTSTPITPVGQRPSLSETIGTPTTPSASEMKTFKDLKTRLAMLILDLPPYVVARVDGDKLNDLAVSTEMIMEADNDRGILEDDTPIPTPKHVAHASHQPTSITPRPTAPNSYGNLPAANQYNRTAQAPIAGRTNSSYYPQQQAQTPRTPAVNYARPGAQTYAAGYPSTGQRAGYGPPSYNASNRQSFNQQPIYPQGQQPIAAARGSQYNSFYNNNAATPGSARTFQQTPTQGYATRPAQQGYSYNQGTPIQQRTASPMQAAAAASPGQYTRPTSGQGSRAQFYTPQGPAPIGPTGYHSTMSNQEQQMLMERQQQRAAQQAVHQQHSRISAMGPTSHLPSANSPAGGNYLTPTRTLSNTPQPAVQTNGAPSA